MSVILVNLGIYQDYTNDNIENLLKYDNEIIMIIEKHMEKNIKFKEKIRIIFCEDLNTVLFDKKSRHDKNFRQGFWKNSSKRLFCVYEAMKKYNLKNCYHLENDVLIYGNTKDLILPEKKLYLVMDHEKRCIPSIVYIPDYTFLNDLISKYNFRDNDMFNMASFFSRNRDKCDTFPIINKNSKYGKEDLYNKNFDHFNIIFDGAAIGQYLGGIDPRNKPGNTRGFINETTVVDYSKYQFEWESVDNKKKLYIIIDEKRIAVFNIHVHCKNLKQFI